MDRIEQEQRDCLVTVDKVTQTPDAVLCALHTNQCTAHNAISIQLLYSYLWYNIVALEVNLTISAI